MNSTDSEHVVAATKSTTTTSSTSASNSTSTSTTSLPQRILLNLASGAVDTTALASLTSGVSVASIESSGSSGTSAITGTPVTISGKLVSFPTGSGSKLVLKSVPSSSVSATSLLNNVGSSSNAQGTNILTVATGSGSNFQIPINIISASSGKSGSIQAATVVAGSSSVAASTTSSTTSTSSKPPSSEDATGQQVLNGAQLFARLPIMDDGMGICIRCGNVGVKDTFYGKGKQFCSTSCSKNLPLQTPSTPLFKIVTLPVRSGASSSNNSTSLQEVTVALQTGTTTTTAGGGGNGNGNGNKAKEQLTTAVSATTAQSSTSVSAGQPGGQTTTVAKVMASSAPTASRYIIRQNTTGQAGKITKSLVGASRIISTSGPTAGQVLNLSNLSNLNLQHFQIMKQPVTQTQAQGQLVQQQQHQAAAAAVAAAANAAAANSSAQESSTTLTTSGPTRTTAATANLKRSYSKVAFTTTTSGGGTVTEVNVTPTVSPAGAPTAAKRVKRNSTSATSSSIAGTTAAATSAVTSGTPVGLKKVHMAATRAKPQGTTSATSGNINASNTTVTKVVGGAAGGTEMLTNLTVSSVVATSSAIGQLSTTSSKPTFTLTTVPSSSSASTSSIILGSASGQLITTSAGTALKTGNNSILISQLMRKPVDGSTPGLIVDQSGTGGHTLYFQVPAGQQVGGKTTTQTILTPVSSGSHLQQLLKAQVVAAATSSGGARPSLVRVATPVTSTSASSSSGGEQPGQSALAVNHSRLAQILAAQTNHHALNASTASQGQQQQQQSPAVAKSKLTKPASLVATLNPSSGSQGSLTVSSVSTSGGQVRGTKILRTQQQAPAKPQQAAVSTSVPSSPAPSPTVPQPLSVASAAPLTTSTQSTASSYPRMPILTPPSQPSTPATPLLLPPSSPSPLSIHSSAPITSPAPLPPPPPPPPIPPVVVTRAQEIRALDAIVKAALTNAGTLKNLHTCTPPVWWLIFEKYTAERCAPLEAFPHFPLATEWPDYINANVVFEIKLLPSEHGPVGGVNGLVHNYFATTASSVSLNGLAGGGAGVVNSQNAPGTPTKTGGKKKNSENSNTSVSYYWFVKIVGNSGCYLRLRYIGLDSNPSHDFWINFRLRNLYPVGYAKANGHRMKIPREVELYGTGNYRTAWQRTLASCKITTLDLHGQFLERLQVAWMVPGLRVEAQDKTKSACFRPATVDQLIGDRIHVRYDGDGAPVASGTGSAATAAATTGNENDTNGLWTHLQGGQLRPIGWSQLVGHELYACEEYAGKSLERGCDLVRQHVKMGETSVKDWGVLTRLEEFEERMKFKEGMKLEAVDPFNQLSICVVTIRRVLRFGFLLLSVDNHLDDPKAEAVFCAHASSPYLLPAGFCAVKKVPLQQPAGYTRPFQWPEYTILTQSIMAPIDLFATHAKATHFAEGMLLEAVDLLEPNLICIAIIKRVVEHLLLLHFIGWEDSLDQWCDCRSPNIFPVGYCDLVGYPLQGPPGKDGGAMTPTKTRKNRSKRKSGSKSSGSSSSGGDDGRVARSADENQRKAQLIQRMLNSNTNNIIINGNTTTSGDSSSSSLETESSESDSEASRASQLCRAAKLRNSIEEYNYTANLSKLANVPLSLPEASFYFNSTDDLLDENKVKKIKRLLLLQLANGKRIHIGAKAEVEEDDDYHLTAMPTMETIIVRDDNPANAFEAELRYYTEPYEEATEETLDEVLDCHRTSFLLRSEGLSTISKRYKKVELNLDDLSKVAQWTEYQVAEWCSGVGFKALYDMIVNMKITGRRLLALTEERALKLTYSWNDAKRLVYQMEQLRAKMERQAVLRQSMTAHQRALGGGVNGGSGAAGMNSTATSSSSYSISSTSSLMGF